MASFSQMYNYKPYYVLCGRKVVTAVHTLNTQSSNNTSEETCTCHNKAAHRTKAYNIFSHYLHSLKWEKITKAQWSKSKSYCLHIKEKLEK